MKINNGKAIPELKCLLDEVEKRYGRMICTTTDFEALAVVIQHETGECLSASTLKRLWGYVSNNFAPRKTTLDILCRFIGKHDFSTWCQAIRNDKSISSQFFTTKTVESSALQPGASLLIGWAPDRLVKLEYLGNCEYVVRESENSKLSVEDHFSVGSMMLGFPLYIPALYRHGESECISYIAGYTSGLTRLDVI